MGTWNVTPSQGVTFSPSASDDNPTISFPANESSSEKTYTVKYDDGNGNCGSMKVRQKPGSGGGGGGGGDIHVNIRVVNNSSADVHITGEALVYFNGESVGVLLTNNSAWGEDKQIIVGHGTTGMYDNCRVTKSKGSSTAPDPSKYTGSSYNYDGITIYSSFSDYTDPRCEAACHGTPPKGSCIGIWHSGDQCCYTRISEELKCKSSGCAAYTEYAGNPGAVG